MTNEPTTSAQLGARSYRALPSTRPTKGAKVGYVGHIKDTVPCHDCGQNRGRAAMRYFDPTGERKYEVTQLVNGRYSWERLIAEIEARILLCHPCQSRRLARVHGFKSQDRSTAKGATRSRNDHERKQLRRSSLNEVKDRAACVRCGARPGRNGLWLVKSENRSIGGFAKSAAKVISDDLSEAHLLAAVYSSDLLCRGCYNRLQAEQPAAPRSGAASDPT